MNIGYYKTMKDDFPDLNVEPIMKKKIEYVKSDKP